MDSFIHSIWTVVVFVVFIGIVAWAYSSRRKGDFEEASRLALDDDDQTPPVKTTRKTEE